MSVSCLECCREVLLSNGASVKPCRCPVDAACAPNGLTVIHAAALANRPGLAAAAAAAAGLPALEFTLDLAPKFHLHLLFESCALRPITDEKHVSMGYRRLNGLTALEVAVLVGGCGPAAELLSAGAMVRPRALSLLTQFCPAAGRDRMASLLAASQACPSALLPHWPPCYRTAVQSLLLCARHGRHPLPVLDAPAQHPALPAEQAQHAQQAAAPVPPCALLALLPEEVLMRVAVLAAAPLSSWQSSTVSQQPNCVVVEPPHLAAPTALPGRAPRGACCFLSLFCGLGGALCL